MKLHIIVATLDVEMASHVSRKKSAIVPAGLDRHGYLDVVAPTLTVLPYLWRSGGERFDRFLVRQLEQADAVILLSDRRLWSLTYPYCEAVFGVWFQENLEGMILQNFLSKTLARVLRNFALYMAHFYNARSHRALILPLKNFAADELARLRTAFVEHAAAGTFYREFEESLSLLLRRQRPRENSEYRDRTYLRDDNDRYFEYGKERHSKIDTAMPPHSPTCLANGDFRFGLRYDRDRHFNVSHGPDGTKISGRFIDCHGEGANVRKDTHLNMFPNSFFPK